MIERCRDYRRIKKFRNMAVSSDIYYLMETRGGTDLGVWTLEPHLDGLFLHSNMGLGCRGRKASKSARDAFTWVFENTEYDKIYAEIPNDNRPARVLANCAGMKFATSGADARGYIVTKGSEVWAKA